MKRVAKIDNIILDNLCFISTEFNIDDYLGERSIAIDGSSTTFVQAKGAMSLEVIVDSKDSGWITKATRDLLIASNDTNTVIIEYDDTTTDTFYYDHTKVPMKITPLFEGALWYNIEINLLKG